MAFRIAPLLRHRLFTTSVHTRTAISAQDATAAQLNATEKILPKLSTIARWYLPTMAFISAGTAVEQSKLDVAICRIGSSITNALNEANRKVHLVLEPTQEEQNRILLEMYGERSSLEDMERAIAGMDARLAKRKDRFRVLEEAYGGRGNLEDLERAMQLYEVQ